MAQQSTATSLLASFATLKGLSDEKKYKSPYQVLQEFIGYIVISESLHSFTAIEMKGLLNEHFSFQIPEAVIRTAAKNMNGVVLNNNTYSISADLIGQSSVFEEKKTEAYEYSISLLDNISQYISNRLPGDPINKNTVLSELIRFLVDDQPALTNRYYELISEYIIKNENNESFQDGLNRIREGSVLYIGLSHNINEIGSISKPLRLYLCTEILFSLVGYNGVVFQQFAKDFYDQVKLANTGTHKKVYLYYFSETKKEIDEFFAVAEAIVDGKVHQWLDKPAMKAITDGCKTSADVAVKESDFFTRLRTSFGITEDPHESYYDEMHFSSNLEGEEFEDENDSDQDKKRKRETRLKLISHINKLREGAHYRFELDAEHLMVTNSQSTLMMSKEQTDIIKAEEGVDYICGFAVSLERITSILWYKLGSGFSTGGYPASISALLKARAVLSFSVAKKANQAFAEVRDQYKEGLINNDQVVARIITLRNKPTLPEELKGDDIEEVMNFSPEYLSRFEEQFRANQKSLKERDELIKSIKESTFITISERDAIIESQQEEIQEKNDENAVLRGELEVFRLREAAKLKRKTKRNNILRFIWSIAWKVLVLISISVLAVYLENKYEVTIIRYILSIVDTIGVLITLWIALKKDKNKYFGGKEDDSNKQDTSKHENK
ncbi:MAG: hypothetical protein II875_08880 [Clostridia bacterium]|nr:hypothetical protein [Clostridia bacterium]